MRTARENRSWGCTRIQGALANLGHEVGRGTIAGILKEAGFDPAPERQRRTTWKEFLRTHWEVLAAADFFTVEIWNVAGLMRYHVFFVIRLASRAVKIAGIVPEPTGPWMNQMARNLTDGLDGFLEECRYFIHDRSSLFTKEFESILKTAAIAGNARAAFSGTTTGKPRKGGGVRVFGHYAGLSTQRICQDLVNGQLFGGSYHSLQRFVRGLRAALPLPFLRLEVEPGGKCMWTLVGEPG